jgi:hypothetical protein
VKKHVDLDVSDEELEEAMRQLEEDERWRAAHPARRMLVDALAHAIITLEQLQKALREK